MMKFLRHPRMGIVWLIARLWVGWEFLSAGWEKVTDSAWVGSKAPSGINSFLTWAASSQNTKGPDAQVSEWYAWLIDHVFIPIDGPMSYVIAFGEVAVGLGLIFGAFTMAAAFFGILMNLNFMLAGATGTGKNPLMLVVALLIMFAGTTAASRYGVDRYMMPRLKEHWRQRKQRKASA